VCMCTFYMPASISASGFQGAGRQNPWSSQSCVCPICSQGYLGTPDGWMRGSVYRMVQVFTFMHGWLGTVHGWLRGNGYRMVQVFTFMYGWLGTVQGWLRVSGYRVGQVSTLKHTVTSPAVYKPATSTNDFWGKTPPHTAHFEGKKRLKSPHFDYWLLHIARL
jgi:hypothetical protein